MVLEELNVYQDTVKEIKRLNSRSRVEKRKLVRFISSCKDELLRNILIERYLNGNSWTATAQIIGGGITGDNCRMMVARYLKGRKRN